MAERDGFIISDADGVEVHFMPCDKNGSNRDRVLSGMLMRVREDFTVADTRDDDE